MDPEGRLFWSWGAVRVTPSSAMTPLNGNPRTPRCGGDLPPRDCLFEGLPKKGEPLAAYYETCDDLLKRFYLIRNETRWFDFSSANLHRKYGADWFAKYSDSCHRRLRSWGVNTIANSSDLRICLQDRTPYAERVEVDSRTIAASWGATRSTRPSPRPAPQRSPRTDARRTTPGASASSSTTRSSGGRRRRTSRSGRCGARTTSPRRSSS